LPNQRIPAASPEAAAIRYYAEAETDDLEVINEQV
jgi:hypothetical protein